MTDERYKALMEQVGMPNSRSLLGALQQVANEVEQEVRAALAQPPAPTAQPATDDRLRMALRADLAIESLAVDDLLRAMGEDPEQYRTEGGAVNRLRLLAWLKDRAAQPVQQPGAEPQPSGYESTTTCYTRWVSPERWAKFSPGSAEGREEMKKFLARLKYYLGFRSIIKKDDGSYYVVKGVFFQEARDKTDHQYWWGSVESKKAYCKCANLVEARELFYKPTLPKTEIIV